MRLLLDTHLLVWTAIDSHRMPRGARRLLEDPNNDLFFSAASLWEIAIKHGLERKDFVLNPRLLRRGLLDHGYGEILITSEHGIQAGALPLVHRDPFDRLLVAQALVEGITLLTVDTELARYVGPIQRV